MRTDDQGCPLTSTICCPVLDCTHVHAQTHIHTQTQIHMDTHRHTHTHIHTNTHTHNSAVVSRIQFIKTIAHYFKEKLLSSLPTCIESKMILKVQASSFIPLLKAMLLHSMSCKSEGRGCRGRNLHVKENKEITI